MKEQPDTISRSELASGEENRPHRGDESPRDSVTPLTRANVLLVDDDSAMTRLLAKWLDREGYQTRSAGDGREALAAIEAECPDVLLTDWDMPNMDGLELCRRVRELNLPHYVYIVFLTVRSTPAEMIRGLEAGADDFLSKPVDQRELLARMRSAVRVFDLERRLNLLARNDLLTGLMTQRIFYETLEKERARVRRSGAALSCVMMDIDFFKRVNDVHGHPAGDAVLKSVAELISKHCRVSDSPCRYGGEEFCVLLPDATEENAVRWAERVRQTLAANIVSINGRELRITASFGVAQHRDDVQTAEELVDRADQALLCAKQSGRDCVVAFDSLNNANDVDFKHAGQYGMFQETKVSQVMSPVVACLREDQTVGQAAEFFLRSRINSTPVVDAEGKLVGILSEKDLLAAMIALDSWQLPVREVMKSNVIWYEEGTPIQTVYDFLCRVSIRRVVIVADGRPTGTISRGTLLRWFRNMVAAQGLLKLPPNGPKVDDLDQRQSRKRLADTAGTLARLASKLQCRIRDDGIDPFSHVIGGATIMQTLVNDLLAFSRYAKETSDVGPLRSLLLSTNHMD
jgi:two-component system, cell cycle response regulator